MKSLKFMIFMFLLLLIVACQGADVVTPGSAMPTLPKHTPTRLSPTTTSTPVDEATATSTGTPEPTETLIIPTATIDPNLPAFSESGTMRSENVTLALSSKWMDYFKMSSVTIAPENLEIFRKTLLVYWAVRLAQDSSDPQLAVFKDVDEGELSLVYALSLYEKNAQLGAAGFQYEFDFGDGVVGKVEKINIRVVYQIEEWHDIVSVVSAQELNFASMSTDPQFLVYFDQSNTLHLFRATLYRENERSDEELLATVLLGIPAYYGSRLISDNWKNASAVVRDAARCFEYPCQDLAQSQFEIESFASEIKSCPGAPPIIHARTRTAMVGMVPSIPSRVRAQPNLDATILGEIFPGQEVTIVDGPVCADEYTWWKIQNEDTVGWTIEGDRDGYWLTYPIAPTPGMGQAMIAYDYSLNKGLLNLTMVVYDASIWEAATPDEFYQNGYRDEYTYRKELRHRAIPGCLLQEHIGRGISSGRESKEIREMLENNVRKEIWIVEQETGKPIFLTYSIIPGSTSFAVIVENVAPENLETCIQDAEQVLISGRFYQP